jgi:hypothetical protein
MTAAARVHLKRIAIAAIALGAVVWAVEILVGLNSFGEGEPLPWWMRLSQGLGYLFILGGAGALCWRALSLWKRRSQP